LAQKDETGICFGAPFRVVLERLLPDLRREAANLLILLPVLLERDVRLPERALDVLREGVFVFFLWAISVRLWELRMGIRRSPFSRGTDGAIGPFFEARIPPGLQANYSTNGLYYQKPKDGSLEVVVVGNFYGGVLHTSWEKPCGFQGFMVQ